MTIGTEPFVHVLLFQCSACGNAMSSAITTSERNPEDADTRSFALRCKCGWTGTQIGVLAKRHWVEPWA
jgi:hypothetical protein